MKKLLAGLLMFLLSVTLLIPTAFAAEYTYECPKSYDISGTEASTIELEQAFFDGATEYKEGVTTGWTENGSAGAGYYYYTGWQGDGSKRTYTIPVTVEETIRCNIEFAASEHSGGYSRLSIYVDDKLAVENEAGTGKKIYGSIYKFTANDILVTKDTETIKVVITAVGTSQANRHAYSVDYVSFTPICNFENGAVAIEKASWADKHETNITTGYAGIGYNGWISYKFDVPLDGKYDVIINAGTTTGMVLDAVIGGQQVTQDFESTSTADKVGWDVPVDKSYGSFYLKKGEHTLTITGKGSGSIYLRKIILKSVGNFNEILPPDVNVDSDNKTVTLEFGAEICSEADNLALITVTDGYGTPTVAIDETDAKKVIISNVVGNFKIVLKTGLLDIHDAAMYSDYMIDCYIPSCTETQKTIFTTATNYYGQVTFSAPIGSPKVRVWFVLYDVDENGVEKVVGYVGNDNYGLWDGRQISISLPVETYKDKFNKARLFAWEQDMTPLMKPVEMDF